jgi:hypothetical protein
MPIKREPQLGTTRPLRASRLFITRGFPLRGVTNEVNCGMNDKVPIPGMG